MDQLFLPEEHPKKYNGPALPAPEEILIQLFKGLKYIHDNKYVHRDIKPQNVLVSLGPPVRFLWTDFGLCKAFQGPNSTFTPSDVRGTYCWLSPEEYEEYKNPDPNFRGTTRSDIFSVGCLAFFYLTGGSHPFGPLVDRDIEKNVLNEDAIHMNSKL